MEENMPNKINRKKWKEFFFRRKINMTTLLVITLMSILITGICLMTGFLPERVVLLELVTAALIVLSIVQTYRMKSSFRTMKDFKGKRKKRDREE